MQETVSWMERKVIVIRSSQSVLSEEFREGANLPVLRPHEPSTPQPLMTLLYLQLRPVFQRLLPQASRSPTRVSAECLDEQNE